jgi:hypothetical protein
MIKQCFKNAQEQHHVLNKVARYLKYYALVEFLDMQPEDVRLTDIDNVFLLRKAKRLPYEKRSIYAEVKKTA